MMAQVRPYTLDSGGPRRRGVQLERRSPRRAASIPVRDKGVWVQSLQCSEPESYLQCDGITCRPETEKTRPDVISISACQDGERTWDTTTRVTFMQALITLLKSDRNMPLRQLLHRAGVILHNESTLKLHNYSRKKLETLWAARSPDKEIPYQYEIFNSPMPQIGSTHFLPHDERFRA